ncbi:solute carrier family 10 (sodium/bile acid cotransporter), member 7 [Cupriavidus gilardii CR3]|uniref:Bile acid:sodium symporter n=1 Tax=Cupriavidus gilardii TaxID=82541 RepID=A0A6N1BSU8_9BURK|nr:bile acid:sodium symporter family protein [Cupriavidus gilardii]ALD91291.1 solute carrier family 10 (sodium/bile acid cotransporter), member 7 [Cupriavidus gilardii CR3]QQE06293.1 bile acid:sodium symporter [Cupriavidus sp. ISTL7]KAB0598315.1 bile acid:sodium symporter [Cupriavidus gilardii]MCT9012486.1 bile acid:sodium symporter [Cupriavidus gilardii]MCT9054452.1 bile acid:sodium symporter [Cupriavidus gilardii]
MSFLLNPFKKLYDLIDGFVLIMLAAIAVALAAPELGTGDGPLHLGLVTSLGVALVFFLHGAALSRDKLVAGAKHWRLHTFVQVFTYVVFPLIGAALMFALHDQLPADLLLGVFFLCALPSTVSSSVAMTSMARGNVPGAIFNATISGLIGMALTPLLMGLVISASGASMPLGKALTGVALQLLLPFALGQLARPVIGAWLGRHKAITSKIDRGVIVLIVYSSFCDATAEGLWHQYSWQTIASVMALAAVLLFAILATTTFVARRLGFAIEDEITAVFCGSKKSLANGIPMAKILFAGHPALGLLVLPLMVYHQLQLIVCSVMASRYANREQIEGAVARA